MSEDAIGVTESTGAAGFSMTETPKKPEDDPHEWMMGIVSAAENCLTRPLTPEEVQFYTEDKRKETGSPTDSLTDTDIQRAKELLMVGELRPKFKGRLLNLGWKLAREKDGIPEGISKVPIITTMENMLGERQEARAQRKAAAARRAEREASATVPVITGFTVEDSDRIHLFDASTTHDQITEDGGVDRDEDASSASAQPIGEVADHSTEDGGVTVDRGEGIASTDAPAAPNTLTRVETSAPPLPVAPEPVLSPALETPASEKERFSRRVTSLAGRLQRQISEKYGKHESMSRRNRVALGIAGGLALFVSADAPALAPRVAAAYTDVPAFMTLGQVNPEDARPYYKTAPPTTAEAVSPNTEHGSGVAAPAPEINPIEAAKAVSPPIEPGPGTAAAHPTDLPEPPGEAVPAITPTTPEPNLYQAVQAVSPDTNFGPGAQAPELPPKPEPPPQAEMPAPPGEAVPATMPESTAPQVADVSHAAESVSPGLTEGAATDQLPDRLAHVGKRSQSVNGSSYSQAIIDLSGGRLSPEEVKAQVLQDPENLVTLVEMNMNSIIDSQARIRGITVLKETIRARNRQVLDSSNPEAQQAAIAETNEMLNDLAVDEEMVVALPDQIKGDIAPIVVEMYKNNDLETLDKRLSAIGTKPPVENQTENTNTVS